MVGDGKLRTTLREQLEILAGHGDQESIDALDEVKAPPRHAEHVWRYFHEIHETERPVTGMGPCRIPRFAIRGWERDECVRLAGWERQAILKLDALWVKSVSTQGDKKPDDESEAG